MKVVERPAPRREATTIDKDSEIRYLRFAIINQKKPFGCDGSATIQVSAPATTTGAAQ